MNIAVKIKTIINIYFCFLKSGNIKKANIVKINNSLNKATLSPERIVEIKVKIIKNKKKKSFFFVIFIN